MKRVVVTGMGAVTPIGNNVEEFWDGIKKNKVGIGEITKFDVSEYKCKMGAEVKDFDPKQYMDPKAASMQLQLQAKQSRMPALILRKKT